jgi:hypothetical protein
MERNYIKGVIQNLDPAVNIQRLSVDRNTETFHRTVS